MSELYTKVAEQRGNDPLSVAGLGCIAYRLSKLPDSFGRLLRCGGYITLLTSGKER